MRTDAALLEQPRSLAEPRPYRFTSEEVYHLAEQGFFEGRRIELIEGEIVEMAAQSNWHAIHIKLTEDALNAAFGPEYWVRVQATLDLTPISSPDPDLAVVKGAVREHLGRGNPTTALLVVEVSDTTLRHDRKRKGSLYARAGILDYWIVNVEKQFLEVYREPGPDETADFGSSYQKVNYLEMDEEVEALALPGKRIRVGDLMP